MQLAFIDEHLNKRIQAPLIEDCSIAIFVSFLLLFHNHLSLGEISDHHGSFNQCVSDQMTCLVEQVSLLVAFLL